MKPLSLLCFLPHTFSLATNGLADQSKEELEGRLSANLYSGQAQPALAGLQLIETLNAFAGQAVK
jgi:hypothetical protein